MRDITRLWVGSVVMLLACSADTAGSSSRGMSMPVPTMAGMPATAQAGSNADFGNANPMQAAAGADGAPPKRMPAPQASCNGGLYLGTYRCDLDFAGIVTAPLEGDVSFNLEINASVMKSECDLEFCPDLVIAEGSGTLFGLAGAFGFEAKLSGGLDCQTREFRASAPDGTWGLADSSNPDDPDALWTVVDPPWGAFTGSLDGTYEGGPAERIAGEWDLLEPASGIRCPGPFTVTLQP